MAVDWNKINAILGSRTGEAALNIGGGLLEGIAQGKQADKNRAQDANQFATTAQLALARDNSDDARARAVAAADLAPLGANENFVARQAFLREVLPQLRNFSVTPGDPAVAAAMGQTSGGFRLPEGGLSPETLAAVSEAATANAIGHRAQHIANVDPNSPNVDIAAMGISPEAAQPAQNATDAFQQSRAQALTDQQTSTQQLLQAALDRDYAQQQQKKGGGFWSKLGKIAAFAAPIVAAPFTGGATLALIGAGAGAASGALNGGGVKGALAGAATGGLASGAIGAAKGALSKPKVSTPPFVPNPQQGFDPLQAALRCGNTFSGR